MEFNHELMGRWHGVAVVDVAGTVVGAYALAQWRGWPLAGTVLGAFAVGHAVHKALGVRTALA